MRSILSLPLELHEIIFDYVEPGDIPSLYSSCKSFKALVGDRLDEHKHLTELHRTRHDWGQKDASHPFSNASQAQENWPALRRLILDIEENPRFAWYIQEPLWEHPPDQRAVREISTDRGLVHKIISESRFIGEDERDDWTRVAERAEAGVLLALLLSQLPRLRSLNIQSKPEDQTLTHLTRIISRVAERSHQGYLDQPLSSLETVDVRQAPWSFTWEEKSMGITLRLLLALKMLPNLKRLSLYDYSSQSLIDNETEQFIDWKSQLDGLDPFCPLFHGPSRLKSIEIITGSISSSVLSVLLRNCATLEDFKYRIEDSGEVFGYERPQQDPLPDFLVSNICMTLLAHACLSLKSLHLEIDGWNPTSFPVPRWNLDQFAALEYITLDSDLFGQRPKGWPLFANILPVSLKAICILEREFSTRMDKPMIQIMLQDFRPQSFPQLHTFTVWRNSQRDDEPNSPRHIIPTYKTTISNAGIPQSRIHDYHVDYNVFLDRRKARTHPQPAYHDGRFGWDIHELPAGDTAGHLIMGVYHAQGATLTPVHPFERSFDGVNVKKDW